MYVWHVSLAIFFGVVHQAIFVRWKPIEEQPIGWEPDINDGVRLNIRPFMAPDMPDGSRKGADIPGGRKGAGILRWKPNIKWSKDRGKEPSRCSHSSGIRSMQIFVLKKATRSTATIAAVYRIPPAGRPIGIEVLKCQ